MTEARKDDGVKITRNDWLNNYYRNTLRRLDGAVVVVLQPVVHGVHSDRGGGQYVCDRHPPPLCGSRVHRAHQSPHVPNYQEKHVRAGTQRFRKLCKPALLKFILTYCLDVTSEHAWYLFTFE